MQVQLFLDCSASMGKDNDKKAAYAVATAAALGYLAVHNMDKVTFHLMKGNHAENPFGKIIGKTPFFRAIGELEKLEFSDDTDIAECVTTCQDDASANGLSVIISDFLTDSNWKKAVDYLCYKKRQVLLIQVLTPEELDPSYDGRVTLIDSESVDLSDPKNMKIRITRSMQKAYEEALADFKKDIRDFCMKRGVDFITLSSDTPIEKAFFSELLKVGIMES